MLKGRTDTPVHTFIYHTDIPYLEASKRIMPLTEAGITVILFLCLADDFFLAILHEQLLQGNGNHFAFIAAIIHTKKIKFISLQGSLTMMMMMQEL